MLLYFFITFIILIIICLYLLNVKSNHILESLQNNNINEILNKCQVPTLNMEQCYKSKYYECPIVNGSYLQCTNNYIPKPNTFNAECDNRTFDMAPYPNKISKNCYYNNLNFDREKEFGKVKFI